MINIHDLDKSELRFLANLTLFEITDPDNINKFFSLVNKNENFDKYLLIYEKIDKNEEVKSIVSSLIDGYNDLAKSLNETLLIFNKDKILEDRRVILMIYLRYLIFKKSLDVVE